MSYKLKTLLLVMILVATGLCLYHSLEYFNLRLSGYSDAEAIKEMEE